MIGNVSEWTSDRSTGSPQVPRGTDPLGEQTGDMRVVRGCSFFHDREQCFDYTAEAEDPELRQMMHGLRPVRTLLE